MSRLRVPPIVLALATLVFLSGCCGANPERQARKAAKAFFTDVQVRDFDDVHEGLAPEQRSRIDESGLRERIDEFRPLSGHTWVKLDTLECSEASCTFEGQFDPTGIRCEIEMTNAGEAWVVGRIDVDGETVIPWE